MAVASIQDVVHIIPRFGKSNEYFVNKIYIIAIRKPVKTYIYNAHLFFHIFFSSCIYNNASIPFFFPLIYYIHLTCILVIIHLMCIMSDIRQNGIMNIIQ